MTRQLRAVATLAALVLLAACASQQSPRTSGPPVFFPAPPATPRLQHLATLSTAADVEERSSLAEFVAGGRHEIALTRPHGTVWDRGCLYVCDPGAGALMAFDFQSHELRRLLAEQPGTLQKPLAIAVAPDGWKYVVDAKRNVVVVLDESDRFRTTFGDPDEWRPVGIAAGPERIYVTDVTQHRIVVLDRKSGAQLDSFGEGGDELGQFYYPVEVLLGPQGDLWVTDTFNCRIQRLRTDGTAVDTFGTSGDRPGMFARPKSVAVDREGRSYVVDAAFENVQVFNDERRLLLFFGAPGMAPGAMNLPAHVTLSYDAASQFSDRVAEGYDIDYVLFVSSQLGDQRINVYGLLNPR